MRDYDNTTVAMREIPHIIDEDSLMPIERPPTAEIATIHSA